MTAFILHHYQASPYSEKVRLMLGHKQLDWQSVTIPIIAPKPDLIALTGGYRKTPVMQVGADIICDSRLIARQLDALAPAHPLIPADRVASVLAFEQWESRFFLGAVPVVLQPRGAAWLAERLGPEVMQQFGNDRASLFKGGEQARPDADYARVHFLPGVAALDQQLERHDYLVGDGATLADFAMLHPIWFVNGNPAVRDCLLPFAAVQNWQERVSEVGHGRSEKLDAAEAIEIARNDTSDGVAFLGSAALPDGIKVGDRVQVAATDYGTDPIVGTLLHASTTEIVVGRTDVRAGEIRVHTPRDGFSLTPAT